MGLYKRQYRVVIFFALVADMTLLPALLLKSEKKKKEKPTHEPELVLAK